MTCQEAIKRLYDCLNAEEGNLSAEQMEKNWKLCLTCCSYCKFSSEVIHAMQVSFFQKKPTPDLKKRIIEDLNL